MVLADAVPLVTMTVPRQKKPDPEYPAKEVRLDSRHCIVCRNPAEAEPDAADREAIVTSLRAALSRGNSSAGGRRQSPISQDPARATIRDR